MARTYLCAYQQPTVFNSPVLSLNKVYVFYDTPLPWAQARQVCKEKATDIAAVADNDDRRAIADVLAEETYTWIGLNDMANEGTFQWADGSTAAYRPWAGDQPDDEGGNEDCVLLAYSNFFDDYGCAKTYNFLCERLTNSTTVSPPVTCS